MAGEQPNPLQLAQSFVGHYYNLFDRDRAKLPTLYRPVSTLTFEGKVFKGVQEIGKKLATADLGFQRVLHRVLQCDVQPSGLPGGIIVQTVGELKVDDEERPLKFTQLFHLLPEAPNSKSYYVHNDLFRLVYG